MSGARSRNKGAKGEREVIGILQPIVTEVCKSLGRVELILKRNYTQRFESKQYDVEGIPWMALEVKRHENLSGLEGWWRQVLASCREGQVPVLMYRQNNGPWRVRMKASLRVAGKGTHVVTAPVTLSKESFLVWFRERLKLEESIRRDL